MKLFNSTFNLDDYRKMGITDKLVAYGVNRFYSEMQCEISLTLLDYCTFDKYTVGLIFIKSIDSFLNVVDNIGLNFDELETLRKNSIRALYGDDLLSSVDDSDLDELFGLLTDVADVEGNSLTNKIDISENSTVGKFISILIEDLKNNGYSVVEDNNLITISGWK